MVALELEYLLERGRVVEGSTPVLAALQRDLGVISCRLPFDRVVRRAGELRWTRDPFDRLIAAQAAEGGGALITKDRHVREHCTWATWSN
jgi:PIN domain nuclease of toxin-antitoxin system